MLSRPKLTVDYLLSPVSSSFVLVTFALVAFGLLGDTKLSADERDDRPVVMISAGPIHFGEIEGSKEFYNPDAIYREIARQAVMIILREEFGLATRDDSLFEPMDKESDHFYEMDVKTISGKSVTYTISQRGKQLYEKQFSFNVGRGTYHRFAVKMEEHSQKELIDFFKKVGYKPRKHKMIEPEDSKPLPDELETELRTMNHLSQFRAVRKLHRLLDEEGETTERVSGLVRGYSNLSQMMFSTFDTRSRVFAARAMLYARRMRRVSHRSLHSLATEAYSDAMLGFPNRARGHYQSCIKRFEAEKKEPTDWLPLINSYCGYRNSEIEEFMNDDNSSLREIAALFRFRSAIQAHMADTPSVKDTAGRAVLDIIPTCLWVYDRLTYGCGVSSGYTWTRAAPLALSYQLSDNLPEWTELPDNVMQLVEDTEDGEYDALEVAKVANALIAAAEFDKQEPSYAVLGRNIEAWNVMQVYQLGYFYKYRIGTSVADLIEDMEPVFENHPDADLIRTLGIGHNAAQREYTKAVENYHFKDGNYFSTVQLLTGFSDQTPLGNMSNERAIAVTASSGTYWEHRWCCWLNGPDPSSLANAYRMKTISRDSPIRIATLLRLDWENNKQNFDQWMEDFKEHPIISLSAARILKKQDGNLDRASKYYNRFLEMSPDSNVIREFAKSQFYSESGDWLETLKRIFDVKEIGLEHSYAARTIALNLMHKGEFEEALPWATRANQSGSQFGMECMVGCLTGLGKLDEASEIAQRSAFRYPGLNSASFWLKWCAANEHKDLKAAQKRRIEWLNKTFKGTPSFEQKIELEELRYFKYRRNHKKVCKILETRMKRAFVPSEAFWMISLYDLTGNTDRRDEVLTELIKRGRKEPTIFSQAAPVLRDYFKTGTFNELAIKKILAGASDNKDESYELNYLVLLVRLKREGKKFEKTAIEYLSVKAREVEGAPLRPLAWCQLRDLGVQPERLDNRLLGGCWALGSEAENLKQFLAGSADLSNEEVEQARQYDYDPKRKAKEKAKAKAK